MITEELKANINAVRVDARRRGLRLVTVEHLVLILISENSSVRDLLVNCQADVDSLMRNLTDFLSSRVPAVKVLGTEPKPTVSFQRVLQRAVSQVSKQLRSVQKATGIHVLVAVFSEPESYAAYCLQKCGVERLKIFSHLAKQPKSPEATSDDTKGDDDLVAMATTGRLESPFGRETELWSLIRILSRKYKNNPLLVGEPGVGKTALVHALAHRIATGKVPTAMQGMRLLPVSMADMVAGSKYRGDFEQRLKQLVDKCQRHGNTVLFVDEIHTLIGAGAVSGSSLDAANILKPLLDEETLRCVGATTFNDYRRVFEKDNALARRFQKIEVREPNDDSLRAILQGVINRLSVHHGVQYTPAALEAAVEYSRRYLPNRFLPDKAIDLLDDAGAAQQLYQRSDVPVDKQAVADVAMQMAGLPVMTDDDQNLKLVNLEKQLSMVVLDQDEASRCLSRAILRGQLGFHDGTKTVGAFLFCGPTGVGKTEMARQLALILAMPLLRYDMSEYMDRHSVSRLIGAPPGYVGYDQSGKLVEDVFRSPNAVVLFDEVEKAHPDVLNILLQVLDYGTLTDNSGRSVDFSNTMVVLTSNIGVAEVERGVAGFGRDEAANLGQEAISAFFSAEFRNRLDAVVWFRVLSATTVSRIVDMRLTAITRQLSEKKGIRITISRKLRSALKKDSFSATMGVRPLERLLRERILEPLALAQVHGDLLFGMRYRLDTDGDEVSVQLVKSKDRVELVT